MVPRNSLTPFMSPPCLSCNSRGTLYFRCSRHRLHAIPLPWD